MPPTRAATLRSSPARHPLLREIDDVQLDAALFEIPLGLARIGALLGPEQLDVHARRLARNPGTRRADN